MRPLSPSLNSMSNPTSSSAQVKTVEESADYLAGIIGEEEHTGLRIKAGPILKMMYDTAFSVAMRHSGKRVVLLGLDRLDLVNPIHHMDLVRLEGRIIQVGRSSMVVEIRCFAKEPTDRNFRESHVGFITMVAVDEDGEPVRDIPDLSYDSPLGVEAKTMNEHRKAQLAERSHAMEWIDNKNDFKVSDVVEPDQDTRYQFLKPEQTEIRVKGQVLSPFPQEEGRVKAGELLAWMDKVANYTAWQFTGNPDVVTLSVNDVLFKHVVHATDRVEIISRVIHVRRHTLEVSLEVSTHSLDGESRTLENVDFLILSYGPSGEKKKITTGLLLEGADQSTLKSYIRSRTRFNFWKSNPESYLIQTP